MNNRQPKSFHLPQKNKNISFRLKIHQNSDDEIEMLQDPKEKEPAIPCKVKEAKKVSEKVAETEKEDMHKKELWIKIKIVC